MATNANHIPWPGAPRDADIPPDMAGSPPRKQPAANGRLPKLELETNIPVEATLVWSKPSGPYPSQYKDENGNPRPERWLYTVETPEGRRQWFVPSPVVAAIENLGVGPGDPILIGKYKRAGMRYEKIEVERIEETELTHQLKASIAYVESKKRGAEPSNGSEAAPETHTTGDLKPRTKFESVLYSVIFGIDHVRKLAKDAGVDMPTFSADEICRLVNTAHMNGGGR